MAEETVPTPATPAPPAVPPVAPASVPAAPASATVVLPREQFDALLATQARVAQLESETRERERLAREETVRLQVERGEAVSAVQTVRQQLTGDLEAERRRLTEVETRAKRYALDGELSRALAACNLVPAAAEQLTRLWRSEFTVDANGDSFAVRTPTFQSVGDFVQQQLARPEYAHFVRSAHPAGGTGGVPATGQVLPSAPAHPAQAPQPKNMGEAVILHMQSMAKQQGDPHVNMAVPMGLKRLSAAK